ncbi:Cof-type HAD-IIB family hydrolase [Streptococcus pyogenes]|uniref:Cof-type HAD-IIB family hydrolase n=1 Tax=Streptococcus pyogenes TaxID=1314 RepID=UPI0010A0DBF3|nr:Cof-type HAD-IIB family hydrolase [Streptococcus pyogenes]VHH54570.1 hydrolase [Streptococcus pyogenes]VHH75967.1 hydrolase [Streptococcus pyogenes]HER2919169.1 HAD family phosphatase [Streptococcus pyogenes]HER2920353.1 HAD family phosphatase [Streptococcus pyogenes]HER2927097.1 HAD family phosphatase [Streptococcus pyogenes]
MIQLIAIDLDGTLLNQDKQIPKENITAIQEAAQSGLKIVLCTGRPQSGTRPYFDQLGLTQEEFLIINNGCSTYSSPDWQLRHSKMLKVSDIELLEELSQSFPDIYLALTEENDYLVLEEEVPDLVQEDGDLVFTIVKPVSLAELSDTPRLIFQAMYLGEKAALDAFERAVRNQLSQSFHVVRSQDNILEILPQGVSKASALKELVEDLGLTADQVMAIGDAPNDIEMLTYAGLGVAMENASAAIKPLADKVTLTNDMAGVAQAIRQFALAAQKD